MAPKNVALTQYITVAKINKYQDILEFCDKMHWELNTFLFDIMWHIFLHLTLYRHVPTIRTKCPIVQIYFDGVGWGGWAGWAEFTKFLPSCN